MARIALVVPALSETGGGVSHVANFLRRQIRTKTDFDLRIISLSMSSTDDCSLLLHRPRSWFGGVATRAGTFYGEPFAHVGALLGDIEFQRLRPRRALAALLADCDLIQIVCGTPCWALPVLGLGKPISLQVASLTSVERRAKHRASKGLLGLWQRAMAAIVTVLDDRALKQVDAVQVENQWMLAHAKKIATDAIVDYATPGVQTGLFTPVAERDIAGGYILSVGRLNDPRKNVGLLLEAYAKLTARHARGPDLVLAGNNGPDTPFWQRVEELGLTGQVRFVENPSQEEVAELYRHAQSFALASDEEGFGIVVIEAMASGIPVVSTRSGGPDGIICDGEDGFLVDRDDADALADRLFVLSSNLALNRDMGRKARVKAEQRYDENVTGAVFLRVYKSLLGDF